MITQKELIRRQNAWERGKEALALRTAGMTYTAIAERYGVTKERARQIVFKAECQVKWGRRSPVEQYRKEDDHAEQT